MILSWGENVQTTAEINQSKFKTEGDHCDFQDKTKHVWERRNGSTFCGPFPNLRTQFAHVQPGDESEWTDNKKVL